MRTYTLAFSIVAHLAGVAALVVAPLVANDVLPDPRVAIPYMHVVPTPLPPPPAVAQHNRAASTRFRRGPGCRSDRFQTGDNDRAGRSDV
jgi:hypothetical protein